MPGLGQGELKCLFIPLAAGKFKLIFNISKGQQKQASSSWGGNLIQNKDRSISISSKKTRHNDNCWKLLKHLTIRVFFCNRMPGTFIL
jgi:hypothetical protein